MMHVNNEGKIGKCGARSPESCRFGVAAHYPTREEASRAIDEEWNSDNENPLKGVKKASAPDPWGSSPATHEEEDRGSFATADTPDLTSEEHRKLMSFSEEKLGSPPNPRYFDDPEELFRERVAATGNRELADMYEKEDFPRTRRILKEEIDRRVRLSGE